MGKETLMLWESTVTEYKCSLDVLQGFPRFLLVLNKIEGQNGVGK